VIVLPSLFPDNQKGGGEKAARICAKFWPCPVRFDVAERHSAEIGDRNWQKIQKSG